MLYCSRFLFIILNFNMHSLDPFRDRHQGFADSTLLLHDSLPPDTLPDDFHFESNDSVESKCRKLMNIYENLKYTLGLTEC